MKIRTEIIRNAFIVLLGLALIIPTASSFGQMMPQDSIFIHIDRELIHSSNAAQTENSGIEPWMTVPFVSGIVEEEINLESWMIEPFACDIPEEDVPVEDWMALKWF